MLTEVQSQPHGSCIKMNKATTLNCGVILCGHFVMISIYHSKNKYSWVLDHSNILLGISFTIQMVTLDVCVKDCDINEYHQNTTIIRIGVFA